MLARLADYGPDMRHQRTLGALSAGRNLFRLVPEDEGDPGVLLGGDGRHLLAADLRIDNRAELSRALGIAAGDLADLSDPNLLLQALERWGEGTLDRLVGDFAFAFFDERKRTLMLARDMTGQRPLFWHRGADFFAFSSMPSGLQALADIPKEAELESAARFAAFLPLKPDASYHRSIRRVTPGHCLIVTAEGETCRPWWRPPAQELRLRSFNDYVDAYRETLDLAVASRLRGAEKLVATHLSGGWDSSAVTATAARLTARTGGQVIAYTSVPGAPQSQAAPRGRFVDESSLAAATAALYPNVRHELVSNPNGSPVAYLEQTVNLFQRPPYNLCNHDWLAGIRTAARQSGARVLLTGEIGNWTISAAPRTILADYVRQRRWKNWSREALGMLIERRGRVRGVLASSFGPWLPDAIWRGFFRLSSAPVPELPLQPQWLARLAPELELQRFGPDSRPRSHRQATADGLAGLDYGQYRKGILAGWGIDKRDATADRRLIDFTLSLPLEMLMSGGKRRPLARAALSDRLPARVLDERGKGYQAADWHVAITEHVGELYRLADRLEASPAAREIIDLALLKTWLDNLPTSGWERGEVITRYRGSLLFALSAGHFIASTSTQGSFGGQQLAIAH
jgi:asparagine synthase (glutamine-hydrolysing)